ncbi:MAG: hypothetical protein SH856_00725 [Flavobacteriales bacterium]|nr:hypothetical protein [Flavobacteriales bacterium]
MSRKILLLAPFFLLLITCKEKDHENPYDSILPAVDNDNPDLAALEEGSFPWLHEKIFRPTCANSGCHDGTFEPEFRSISSSYNSLVNHPVIANTPGLDFEYRVTPFNASTSFIHERLTTEVENTSGQMPLESNDDWDQNSAMYIQKITDWINAGAKDLYGNPAPSGEADFPPNVYGVAVFPHNNTTTPYEREPNEFGIGPFLVDDALVDVWIFAYDLETFIANLTGEVKASTSASDFSSALTGPLVFNSNPVMALDFGNNLTGFYHKATINLSGASSGSTYYLRNYLEDGVQPNPTEIPNASSQSFWFLIFSMKIV